MQTSVPMNFVFPSQTGYAQPPQTPVLYPPVPQMNPYAGMPMYAVQHQYYQPGPGGKVYMYQPNEIRHRKRTSRHQLQVLEAVFVDDQKPGPAIRKKLAVELSMTPRSVQVWFQNRRAKDKNLAKKAALIAAQQNGASDAPAAATLGEPELPEDDDGPEADLACNSIAEADEDASALVASATPPPLHADSSAASPASQAGSENTSRSASASLPRSSPDLAMFRRGSAPALLNDAAATSNVHVPLGPPDVGRRQSLELSFARMQAHPYPSRLSVAPPSSFRRSQLGGNQLDIASQRLHQRRGSAPRVTPLAAPAVFHNPQAPSSGAANVNGSISTPAFSNNVAGWVNQTAASAAAATNGFIRAPAPQHLPGPLPAKDFSFGAPPASSGDLPRVPSEESIESPTGDAYSRSGSFASFADSDLARAPRFGSFASVSDSDPTHGTRFSSFASAAGSEASASTYYSTLPTPDGWAPDSRRSSFVEFTNTLSNLHVGAATSVEGFPKSTSSPPMDPNMFAIHESSPSSSDSSTGTMLYASSPPAPPSTGNSDQASKNHHQPELNYTLMPSAGASVQEAQRQQYSAPNSYYDSSRLPNVPHNALHSSGSSSLSGAMGDSALGSTHGQASNSLSTSSSSTSLSGLATPLDLPHSYMAQQPAVVTPESAPVFHAPAPSEQLNFVDTTCFDQQNVFYPSVQVQPPSAGIVGGMALGLDQGYPFFST
ncbi:hypothetical protein AURDEDRAFT_114920 [Auricularia subglabra TFB-10046 SS5]|nr:hypothetical protein AURDEDRAFT_114920 [Auricularia subglabra TFB-10046 SS5]